MYELIRAGQQTYYINCPSKIGVYKTDDTRVYLIDSGNDKDAGKKVKKIIDQNNWELAGIINTHSHADHIGGNRYLQQQTGCRIFAKGIERSFTAATLLEPSFLYGGCPPKDLRHKFLMAEDSRCEDIHSGDFPKELETVDLPGHYFEMIGIKTPDGAFFPADSVSSGETLKKYGIPFIYDVGAYLETLDKIEKIPAQLYVPSHADAVSDISELVEINRKSVLDTADKIKEIIAVPMNFEEILKRIFCIYRLKMNFTQYALVGSTVKSYLAWLKDNNQADVEFRDNLLLWRRAGEEA